MVLADNLARTPVKYLINFRILIPNVCLVIFVFNNVCKSSNNDPVVTGLRASNRNCPVITFLQLASLFSYLIANFKSSMLMPNAI